MSDKQEVLQNLKNSLDRLEEYLKLPIVNDRDRAGTIQGFEFCFELSWKTIQKFAREMGVVFASPKQAFSYAIQEGLIPVEQEKSWLAMLDDRNLTSHAYKKAEADAILGRLPNYRPLMEALYREIVKKWK